MAIRFICIQCGQLLSIASRKAGSEIECPKCGFPQTVPTEEAAVAAAAMGQLGPSQEATLDLAELAVYDDEPVPLESITAQPTRGGLSATTGVGSEQPRSLPADLVLYRRQTLYAQAILLAAIAVVAFAAGYLVGRGNASYELYRQEQLAHSEPVLVEGKLIYDPGAGKLAGDEGAVAIALPRGKRPEQRLSFLGLRPHDPPPPDSDKTIRAIRELGGAYVRADASGGFSVVLETGKYYILLISRHTDRPPDDPIDELDTKQMGGYFDDPASLLRDSKYRWTSDEIESGVRNLIEHNFGRDKQHRDRHEAEPGI
jgi:phage FluMu protein Com